jgi:hypothetical protein
MKSKRALACVGLLVAAAMAHAENAQAMCLSAAEIGVAGQLTTIMATGVALRRCQQCLGPEKYGQAVDHYETAGLMRDFRKAQDAIALRERYELVDGIVREAARDYSEALSTDCDACNAMAVSLVGLTSPQATAKFYEGRTTQALAQAVKQCPPVHP